MTPSAKAFETYKQDTEALRASTFAGLAIGILAVTPWVNSEAALNDTLTSIDFMGSGATTWANGKPISDIDIVNTAALDALQQIYEIVVNTRISTVLQLQTPRSQTVYERAQALIDGVYSRPKHVPRLARLAFEGVMYSSSKNRGNPITETVHEVLTKRGTVIERQFLTGDMLTALATEAHVEGEQYIDQSGVPHESFPLPATKEFDHTTPFYHQFIDAQYGAYAVFNAFLEDAYAIDEQVRQIA